MREETAVRRAGGLRQMPDFVSGTHAFRHTMHSALASLEAERVSPHRLRLRSTGRESVPEGTVVGQSPAAGEAIDESTPLTLDIAGEGFYHHLPFGMWDVGGEETAGTREMLEGIDDPLLKVTHWSREGALLFNIAADNLPACARWMTLFGVKAEAWPRYLWYPLASLLGSLAGLAGTREGVSLVLWVLFGLPLLELRYQRSDTMLSAEFVTQLGARSSRLGVSTVAGDSIEDLAALEIRIGPVALAQYEQFEMDAGRQLLLRALKLVVPVSLDFSLEWEVLDRARAPRLGDPAQNSRLGVNCHMGVQ